MKKNLSTFLPPPRGVEVLDSLSWDLPQDASFFGEQCFRYKYDVRNRMIQKQVPGAEAVYLVYDSRNRLVLMQDAMQRERNLWLYTKYDNLNRIIKTGIFESTLSRAGHEEAAWNEEVYPATTSNNETVLTKTYYDNYNWLPLEDRPPSQKEYITDYDPLFYNDENQYPYPLINHQKYDCKGMITGTVIRSEAISFPQVTVNKYDIKNRLIQSVTFNNVLNGSDVITNQYSWNGKVLFTLHHQITDLGNWIKVLKKFNYDELDRLITTEQKIAKENIKDGQFPENFTPVSQIAYNELGQVMQKVIPDIAPQAQPGILETENYDYNIRSWSLGMNREYFNASPGSEQDHFFGYELAYNKTNSDTTNNKFSAPQYNGNITAMAWKSKNKEISRQYDFNYDRLNRLLGASYSQHDPDACTNAITPNFSVSGLSYDANGNILTLNQFGLIPGHNILIDSLKYQYQTSTGYNYSNQLRSVTDASFNSQNLGDFKDNESTTSNDYLYNRNGNLVRDNNKYIANINYNHLNLPVSINIANHTGVTGGAIQYKYDALGNKQEKIVTELVNNTSCTTTTYYMGEAIYEKREGYPGAEGLVKLQFVSNEEGRSVYDTTTPALHYQYMMKDHLGNVRMLLNAEEQPQLSYPNCDFEQEHLLENETYYLNTNTNLTTPPPQFTTSQGTGAQCQLIKNNDAPIGVGKLLKVMATDEVGVKVDYYIPASTVDNTGANPMQNLIVSIISILNNTSYTGSMHGAGTAVGESFAHDVPLNNLLQQQGSTTPSNNVKAYLNILYFDAQFNFICQQSQYQQLSVMGSSQTVTFLGSSMIKAPANGYAYIYVSNESRNPVYIDNFQVVHKPGRIVEETHYYPFGLTMAGISDRAASSLTNKYKFGGKELQNQEFSDGSGLEEYDYGARMFDPQLGVWHNPDPLAEKYPSLSPYIYAFDNPMLFVDPDGRDNIVYLYAADESVTRKQLRQIARQATSNFKEMGLKTQVKVFKGTFNKDSYGKLDKTDAVAVIGNPDAVRKSVAGYNAGFAKELGSSFGSTGKTTDGVNPEQSQNPRGSNVASDGNIIAIATGATKTLASDTKSTFEEGAAFVLNHGAGHNADLNHAGESNGYDENGKYQPGGVYVPQSPNVMSSGNALKGNNLQSFVTSPTNQQPAHDGYLSIKQAYIHRFGNDTPNATLPTQ